MIPTKWLKTKDKENIFSPYSAILIDEDDLKHINKLPSNVFEKLLEITKAELGKQCLEGKITPEKANGAIEFARYLKGYFNK